ncbi:TonB-dependent siderophore receptor [Nostoc sp.]|uniref:TonB-dependent siderophore receptor n=1 Tax=Nostoc sp. TaxID=1180 RepID=UPI002FF47488
MKLDNLFQSLLLTGAVVLLIGTPAKGKEVREDGIGESSTRWLGKSTLDDKVAVTDTKSPVSAPSSRKPGNFQSQIASYLGRVKSDKPSQNIPQLSKIELPATRAIMLVDTPTPTNTRQSPPFGNGFDIEAGELVQGAGSPNPETRSGEQVVLITGVKVNPTDKGVEVILETSKGEQLQLVNRSAGNSFVTDVPNAQLRLPSGDAFTFRSEKPIAGVTEITVTNFDANTIRVTVIGDAGVPAVELFDSPDEGLVFSVASTATSTPPQQQSQTQQKPEAANPESQTQPSQPPAGDQPIELVVTGEQDGYSVPDASTATKTDTALRDIPQSIQVVPQEVIKDQKITRITDAVRNVSGVTVQKDINDTTDSYNIRGFSTNNFLKDGVSVPFPLINPSPYNIERVEVLKGPASVLYGRLEPGGIVNYVSKQPLSEPYYSGEFAMGNYDFYNPSIDISGPLTEDKRLLYRFNGAYESSGSFVDFVNQQSLFLSPTLTYKIGDATTLNLSYNYVNTDAVYHGGLPTDPRSFDAPRNRFLEEPNDGMEHTETHSIGLNFSHRFNKHLEFRSIFSTELQNYNNGSGVFRTGSLQPDGRTVTRDFAKDIADIEVYSLQNNLIADFNTGSIEHKLLFGVDWTKLNALQPFFRAGQLDIPVASIDLFDPKYGASAPTVFDSGSSVSGTFSETSAIYLQDQVTLLPNLKLLLGGRYDFVNNASSEQPVDKDGNPTGESTRNEFSGEAFSPRIGIVYQPIEPLSLYASYSQSFVPNDGRSRTGEVFEPSRGTQYEVGIRAELLDRRLVANVAAYEITKTNVLTTDPGDRDFSIAAGEVTSRGIEFDLAGKILPGWNVIGSFFLNDAFISKDNTLPEGDKLTGAPSQGGSLWTTYEIQSGNLQGFGFGAGVFFAGSRDVTLPNTFKLPSYGKIDAALFYRRDNWRVGINFKNLLDTKYYESTSFGDIRPAAPFTVLGTVSISF